jgi:hypothetical protein
MLGSVLASLLSGQTAEAVQRYRDRVLAYALATVAIIVGVCFLFVAAYIAAKDRYGAIYAALGFAAAFFVIAGLVWGYHVSMARKRAKRAAERRSSEMKAYVSAAAVALLPALLKSRVGVGGLLLPILALTALGILRENTRRPDHDNGDHNDD